jgi:four helix bundle protein
MRDYKKIGVWQKSHQLTLKTYKAILPLMPIEEKFSLTSQLRRAISSVPMNIAEGCGKRSDKDFCHYLDNALGSILEAEYTVLLIFDLGYIPVDHYDSINKDINEVKAMLIGFIKFLRNEK